jgi:predicted GNAT family acetyltransferase
MALRLAEENDRGALLGYLGREPELNLFFVGDILNFGVHGDDIDIYLEQSKLGIEAVLMHFRESLLPYTHTLRTDLRGVSAKINALLEASEDCVVNGKTEVVDAIRPHLHRVPDTEHDQFFSVCRTPRASIPLDQLGRVRLARPEEAEEVAVVLEAVFGTRARRGLREDIEQGKSDVAIIRSETGEIVATASCVAETDRAAMIIDVATLPSHRRHGYASACTYHLVAGLAQRGKSACLFFHNPAAGAIYHRLGFEDLGRWKTLRYDGKRA